MNGTKSNTAGDRIRVSYRIFDYKAQFAECVAPLLNDLEEGFAAGRSNLTRKMNANIRSQKPPQDLLIIRGERFKELTKYRFVLLALHGLVRRWEISPSHGLSANPSDLTQTEPKGSPPPAVCRTPSWLSCAPAKRACQLQPPVMPSAAGQPWVRTRSIAWRSGTSFTRNPSPGPPGTTSGCTPVARHSIRSAKLSAITSWGWIM